MKIIDVKIKNSIYLQNRNKLMDIKKLTVIKGERWRRDKLGVWD